ncbi:glycosyltransferase [Curtobacterium flaccumfaciens]|uniref:glycosyltransferase n=1 Tax=Curtobacterium flaccumfaciens TaxID=2035 RepID=UPI003D9A7D5A
MAVDPKGSAMSREQSEAVTWHIVTVSFNSATELRKHWANTSLPASTRWTVVDNASTDESVSVARELGAHVIPLDSNVGFGAANNVAARSVSAQYVLFVNPDVEVRFESLPDMAKTLERKQGIVLAPQLLEPDGRLQPSGRGFPALSSKVLNRLPGADSRNYQILASDGERRYVSWAIGAAIAMSGATFDRLGWDERFFVYYEDSDLGLRAWKSGHPVVLDGTVRWVHAWARETASLNVRAWRLELPSMFKFYSRYPHLLLPPVLAARFHPERRIIGQLVDVSTSESSR